MIKNLMIITVIVVIIGLNIVIPNVDATKEKKFNVFVKVIATKYFNFIPDLCFKVMNTNLNHKCIDSMDRFFDKYGNYVSEVTVKFTMNKNTLPTGKYFDVCMQVKDLAYSNLDNCKHKAKSSDKKETFYFYLH